MIDHIGIPVADVARSTAFYEKALAPLGYKLLMSFPQVAGFGVPHKPDFWITGGQAPSHRCHIAFQTNSRAVVKAFYEAALAAGGTDNGAPGVRAQYHESYYGAFVLDPDGHNIEAVCHEAYLG